MRFSSFVPAAVTALFALSSFSGVVAMPNHISSLELSLYKRACNKQACSSAMIKELFPCAAAVGHGATGVVDAFSISQCVVNAINAGINVPSGCKDCGAALSAAAKKLGITDCANAAIAAGGACLRTATTAAKTCVGVFCKLTGIGGSAANPAIPLLPVSNPPSGPIPAQAPAPRPALPAPPAAARPPPAAARPKPAVPPKPAALQAPKPKPVVPPKPAALKAPKPKPVVPPKPAVLQAPKPKPVVPPKPAALKAPKVKPVVPPKPAALKAPKVKPVVPPKPAALKAKPIVPPKPAKLRSGKKIREETEIETRSIEIDEE